MNARVRTLAVIPLAIGIAGFLYALRQDPNSNTEVIASDTTSIVGTTRFCPGIPGGELADGGFLTIANTSDVSSEARITWLTTSGHKTATTTVDPHSSARVDVKDDADLAAAVVEMDVEGSIVEQHTLSEAGNIRTLCTDRTATEWFFADGFTASDSNENIVLTNPYSDAAIVDLSYSTVSGRQRPNAYQGFVVPAESVRILDVAEIGARNEQVVSVQVTATTGRFIASRVQRYRGSGRQGLSVSLGSTRVSGDWWFGFGDTSANTAEQLVVFNPGEKPVSVEVALTGYKPKTSVVVPIAIEVPGGASAVIDMNGIAGLPAGNHGISVVTLGTGEVVVERVINVATPSGQVATTISPAIPQRLLTRTWDIAGVMAGDRIAVVNVTGTKTTFSVSSFGPAGEAPLEELSEIVLPAGGCVIVTIPDPAPNGSVRVTAGTIVVVEYLSSRGAGRIGYSASLAQPIGS
jgi:Family of unknown function (DUF5719)